MAANEKPAETSYLVHAYFFHNSKLLVRGQIVPLSAKDAAPHLAAELLKLVK